ncbi:NAD(P)/FAD-dependent oxidoreductase [Coralliovum pocilloporae]|uniref:NAD(P)/FAD-dependent oxidoreductase n=1 Tax=Coralliovum pocilloporae TaxID=3066369 RepID=UPI00330776B9
MNTADVIIIGAGAAGMMCAIEAGNRGRSVLLLDHAETPGEKIRISGGGRCNFTNMRTAPQNFLSQNPHFCKSALKSYTQHDFVELVKKHRIAFHEKALGQLFCDDSAQQIIDMLLGECQKAGVDLRTGVNVSGVDKTESGFRLATDQGSLTSEALVIATGGKSIPKIGATGFGYEIAQQFDLPIVEPRPALVPLTWADNDKARLKELSGLSVEAVVSHGKTAFEEALLFTHRGLSGPSILQISSYWREGDNVRINLLPGQKVADDLNRMKKDSGKQQASTALSTVLPKRLAHAIIDEMGVNRKMAELATRTIDAIADRVHRWDMKPNGSEGYRTAEVTLGGVDTNSLSSKTMECRTVEGLYFIGEVVDVTGHLGGYNFQWAWSSGVAAGRAV